MRATAESQTLPRPAPPRVHPWVLVVVALVGLALLAVGLGLWHWRRDTIALQTRSLGTLASASADELDRGLQGVLLALQATRDDLREERLRPGHDESAAQLHRRVAALTMARNLWVIDPQGRVLAASSPAAMPDIASFRPALTELGGDAAAISEAFVDLASHESSVAIAMRFVRPDGGAGGWVVAECSAVALLGALPAAGPAPDTRMAVFRNDGVRLAGSLAQRDGPGGDAAIDAQALGDAPLQTLADGSRRLVQQRQVTPLGLRLVITRDLHASLLRWRSMSETTAIGAATVLSVLGLLLWRMLRAERERWQAQRSLLEEREHAALAYAAAREGHWDWDPRGGGFYLSPRMKELLGLPREAAPTGHALAQLTGRLAAGEAAALEAALRHGLDDGQPAIDLVLHVEHDTGRRRAVRLRGSATRDASGRALRLAGVASDITAEEERARHTRQLELKLARTQKLDALGALAGGVAHDFNNILAAVVGYTEMAHLAAADGGAQARQLEQVLQAAQRGKAVIERILSFSRGGLRPARVFAAQPVVEQVLALLAGSADPRVQVERVLDEQPLYLRGDATALFEAVMNLGTNALQAMPEGGVLRIAVQPLEAVADRAASHGNVAAGPQVCIEVSDRGGGIAADVMERLFEPFFSTRGAAGTGLGLAVVHGVASEFGGAVDVHSVPGQGSRFALWLPRVPESEAPLFEAEGPGVVASGAGQCVMVVDDEPALVQLAEELLARMAYEPAAFSDPFEALAALGADPARFDLLITDEVMPALSGTELARRARALRGDLPILLLSGYGGPTLAGRAQASGVTQVLAKPATARELARAIAAALQAATDARLAAGTAAPQSLA